jgi:hypothetical protein
LRIVRVHAKPVTGGCARSTTAPTDLRQSNDVLRQQCVHVVRRFQRSSRANPETSHTTLTIRLADFRKGGACRSTAADAEYLLARLRRPDPHPATTSDWGEFFDRFRHASGRIAGAASGSPGTPSKWQTRRRSPGGSTAKTDLLIDAAAAPAARPDRLIGTDAHAAAKPDLLVGLDAIDVPTATRGSK